jgi:hypothetical protein
MVKIGLWSQGPITGRVGLNSCEMLRIPYCLENLLTDGGEVVNKIPGIHFC